jgi:hypothetical protein
MATTTLPPNTPTPQRETARPTDDWRRSNAELCAKMGRRVRTARRNAGFPTAAASAREHRLRVATVRRLERGLMRRPSAILPVLTPLCEHHDHSLDRLMAGRKAAPDSILMRAMAGDREMIALLKSFGRPSDLRLAAKAETMLEGRPRP